MQPEKYGRLTIIQKEGNLRGNEYWLCQCDCGNVKEIRKYAILKGSTRSCSRIHKEQVANRNRTHGMSYSREYKAWANMINRCNNAHGNDIKLYQDRGITISKEFMTFEGFLNYIGECPEGYELDRINVNGNYEPGNVRWSTESTQCHNQRKRKGMSSRFIGVHWCKYQQAAKELYND